MTEPGPASLTNRLARTSSVAVEVNAEYSQLLMLRALTETVTMIVGMPLDHAADVRLVMDEIVGGLMRHAVPGTQIRCEFDATRERLRVYVFALSTERDPIERTGFAWQLVQAASDHLDIVVHPLDDEAGGHRVDVVIEHLRRDH